MPIHLNTTLRREIAKNISGELQFEDKIALLNEAHYYVEDIDLDGDAPKQFIYIDNASPRISIENNATINHFGLVEYLKNKNEVFHQITENLASKTNENTVIDMLKNEFAVYFIKKRNDLIIEIIKERFARIRNT